ncbi:MAG: aspartate aminotransferase family protein [Bacteroidia bacterium]
MTLRQQFLQYQAQTSPSPILLEIAKGEGIYLFDTSGKKYLDFISGISVSNVGHCAPEVVAAVQKQVATYMHTLVYGEFVMQPAADFAQKLIEVLASELQSVYFTNSGAEATEGALKIAKKYTGRKKIVACKDSYHGSTHGALSVTGTDWIKEGYGPFLEDVHFIAFNSEADLAQIDTNTAAFIVEAVQGEAGVLLPQNDYLQKVRKRCDMVGAVMILDEIQTGFGRAGALFAHQYFGVTPDVLLLAKGMGGGMPIGAFIAKKEMMQVIQQNPILGHITTFGGHPVTTAAGLACLNKILDENLIAQIPEKEALMRKMLVHPAIQAVRGQGLMFAVELGSFEKVLAVCHRALQKGLITDWFLSCTTAIRLGPPLIISLEELENALRILIETIDEVSHE